MDFLARKIVHAWYCDVLFTNIKRMYYVPTLLVTSGLLLQILHVVFSNVY